MKKCDYCQLTIQNEPYLLVCGHLICPRCFSARNSSRDVKYSTAKTIICEVCHLMTSLTKNPLQNQTIITRQYTKRNELQTQLLFCKDCQIVIFDISQFLKSNHRTHAVVHCQQFLPQIVKSLNRNYLSIDLESQALYGQISELSREKGRICEEYECSLKEVRGMFESVKREIDVLERSSLSSFEANVYEVIAQIDSKIKNKRLQIQKCTSYLNCLQTNLQNCKSEESPISDIIQFHFDTNSILEQYCSQLANQRLLSKKQTSIFTINKKPHLDPLKNLTHTIAQINIFTHPLTLITNPQNKSNQPTKTSQQTKSSSFQRKNNQIQEYFEKKRKELFSTVCPEDQILLEDSGVNKMVESGFQKEVKWMNEGNSPLIINGSCYDIEGRINLLRKKLQVNEGNTHYGNSNKLSKKSTRNYL